MVFNQVKFSVTLLINGWKKIPGSREDIELDVRLKLDEEIQLDLNSEKEEEQKSNFKSKTSKPNL